MASQATRSSQIAAVFRVSSGNFLEMYDFFVFAYYAKEIGKAFFPAGSDFASLMLSLMTFGAGYLMRPLGAIVLGSYIDSKGRRQGLIVTLGLMSIGTLSIAIVPSYATIGLAAPVLIVLGRLIQGFSAGVELGGVSVYLSEIATPGNKGFYVSWQSGSQQIAVILVAVLGIVLRSNLPAEDMESWGWRIPMLIGCLIIPFIFFLRRSLQETEDFLQRTHHPTASEILASMVSNLSLVLIGMLMVVMTTVSFYLITAYTPTFGRDQLHLLPIDTLVVTMCVALSNLFWLPVMGALSDRIGRRPILIFFTLLAIVTVYPALSWLIASPSFTNLLIVELWLSFIYGSYNGAMVVYLTEIMPRHVRTSGFALAYSLATCFGGFTPAVCEWMIKETGNKAMPAVWLLIAAVCGLGAALAANRRHVEAAAAE